MNSLLQFTASAPQAAEPSAAARPLPGKKPDISSKLALWCLFWLALAAAPTAHAELTPQQRALDFENLAAQYAKLYGPYEWKRDLLNFDLYNLDPWRRRVREAKSDLEYFEIAAQYVASLQDTHSSLVLPSNFVAFIPISVDVFDGKYLIDALSRAQLPLAQYPFVVGDEVISIDGRPANELVEEFMKLEGFGNPIATRRLAASRLFQRVGAFQPRAHEVGDQATIRIRRVATGTVEEYRIPWTKQGVPLTSGANLPPLQFGAKPTRGTATDPDPLQPESASEPLGRTLLKQLQNRSISKDRARIIGFGTRSPFFPLPTGFQVRKGSLASHFHLSGLFQAEGKRIGYLRFPNFSPPNTNAAINELAEEVAFFQANADGVIIDITRNTGGGCYGEIAAQFLIPYRFRTVADEIRPNRIMITQLEAALANPIGLEAWEIALLRRMYNDLTTAFAENRGRTGPIPACNLDLDIDPIRFTDGTLFALTKPMLVLVDELTISFGDSMAQMLSDAKRGTLFGLRTNGAGASVLDANPGGITEATISYAWTIGLRQQPVSAPGYPRTAYYENVGIWPDIIYDVMTEENLRNSYRPYVQAFTQAMLQEIAKGARTTSTLDEGTDPSSNPVNPTIPQQEEK